MMPLLAAEQPNPAPLLGRLNERVTGQLPQREFVAMALALYDGNSRTLTIANAGLPDPILVATSQAVVASEPRYPIGVRKVLAYESVTAKLVAGEPLGYERLASEVHRTSGDLDVLFASLEKFGAAHNDDWTAVLLEAR
jgi:hypothetical protein